MTGLRVLRSLVWVGLLLCPGPVFSESGDSELELSRTLKAMEAHLGVPVLLPSTESLPDISTERFGFYPIRPADHRIVLRYARLHLEEFRKYSRSFLRQNGLDSIVYVRGLRIASGKIAGTMLGALESPSQRPHGSLVFDVSEPLPREDFIRYVAHHELFHLIDFVHFADAASQRAWIRLNPPGFVYLRVAQSCGGTHMPAERGFVTQYAMAEAGEDRADTFASLLVTPYYRRLLEQMDKDSILQAKVKLMKQQLRRVDASLDESYFRGLHR